MLILINGDKVEIFVINLYLRSTMKLVFQHHQVHFFTDNTDVQPTPATMSIMLDKLGSQHGLMPTYGQMFSLNGEKSQYLIMVSADQSLRVEFQIDRIVITKEGGDLNSFMGIVDQYLDALHFIYPHKQAHRLAIVTNNVYTGIESEYRDLYHHLFTYKKANPFEWDNRIAVKKSISNNFETVNNISTIRRSPVSLAAVNNGKFVDAITCEVDVNTAPENATPRFNLLAAKEFFPALNNEVEITSSLLKRYLPQ